MSIVNKIQGTISVKGREEDLFQPLHHFLKICFIFKTFNDTTIYHFSHLTQILDFRIFCFLLQFQECLVGLCIRFILNLHHISQDIQFRCCSLQILHLCLLQAHLYNHLNLLLAVPLLPVLLIQAKSQLLFHPKASHLDFTGLFQIKDNLKGSDKFRLKMQEY